MVEPRVVPVVVVWDIVPIAAPQADYDRANLEHLPQFLMLLLA